MSTDVAEVRREFREDLAEVRREVRNDLAELRREVRTDLAGLAGRRHLQPATADQPQVVYYPDDRALLEALSGGRIDAIAKGEIGNRADAHGAGGPASTASSPG